MKKSRFSEQQIGFILKQAEDGTPGEEVCWKRPVTTVTVAADYCSSHLDTVITVAAATAHAGAVAP